jgi:prepilin-type N-terminal cleavage/methylation domain-containing protein
MRRHRGTRAAGRQAEGGPGFSLVEVLIGTALFVIILATIYIVLETSQRDYVAGSAKADVQQNVRVVLESMARELRLAGYLPSGAACPGPPAGAVTAVSTSPVSVSFQADVDGNNCVDLITYTFVPPTDATRPCDPGDPATVGRITRTVQEWDPAAGWTPVSPVAYEIAQCISSLAMTYYNGAGATTTVPAEVRRIEVSITGTEQARGTTARSYSLRTDVMLRNL